MTELHTYRIDDGNPDLIQKTATSARSAILVYVQESTNTLLGAGPQDISVTDEHGRVYLAEIEVLADSVSTIEFNP